MNINNSKIFEEAYSILKSTFSSDDAIFREGQYEAIESVFENKRSLVVQKTGWGKSLVYFISTKINRNKAKGVSIVISPLLVLIENQIAAAKKVGLKSVALSSKNKEDHSDIINDLKNNKIDLIFTTPETLFNTLQKHLNSINLGMFIIDEAHCISDWGHDFRLDYRKIVEVLNQLKDKDFPILATTATANDRVVDDLRNQIGPNLYVSRGELFRDNLFIQTIELDSKADRYAWILEHINDFEGTGIIYCLTQKDTENVSNFLNEHNIDVAFYHSGLDEEICDQNLKLFEENKIKALIATIKLGMGYDKPDVSFVIHYQVPKNIVSYYQQIGRSARKIPKGHAIMLKGNNDIKILEYFIEEAFPLEEEMKIVLNQFDQQLSSFDDSGLTLMSISKYLNLSTSKINKALKFLEFEGVLVRQAHTFFLTSKQFKYSKKHYEDITLLRRKEIEELKSLFHKDQCLNKKMLQALDNYSIENCGICEVCQKSETISKYISEESLKKAKEFLENQFIEIIPKKAYKVSGTGFNITNIDKINQINREFGYKIEKNINGQYYIHIPSKYYVNEVGASLSKYGDDGIGSIISHCKYTKIDYPEEVIDKAIKVVTKLIKIHNIDFITYVPSKNNQLMDRFSEKISKTLNIAFSSTFIKISNTSQKNMQNKSFQKSNVEVSYSMINSNKITGKNVLLFDDMIDSGWTFAYLGKELLIHGANKVLPIALTDTSTKEVDYD
jgi:ATP-dependent DNA helicase RecQ